MNWTLDQFLQALRLLGSLDAEVYRAVMVSLGVASASTVLATGAGLPLGLAIGLARFRGKRLLTTVLHALMAVPTVLIGLVFYAILSRQGLLGGWGLLYTRSAIVLGQFALALPLVTALAHAATEGLDPRVRRTAQTLGAGRCRTARTLLSEGRRGYLAAVVAGFGRVFGEVGISMMLGGNIRAYTRTVTTAIALETAKGDVALGIALGIVLMIVALGVNLIFLWLHGGGERA
ncbi:MAG: ABC transporter permease [Phycisphaerae bacterium]